MNSRLERDANPLSVAVLGFNPAAALPPPDAPVRVDGSRAPLYTIRADGTVAPEVVVLCGPAAVGKSSFSATHLPQHERVNQDILRTKANAMKAAEGALQRGRPVVIDATNINVEVSERRSMG